MVLHRLGHLGHNGALCDSALRYVRSWVVMLPVALGLLLARKKTEGKTGVCPRFFLASNQSVIRRFALSLPLERNQKTDISRPDPLSF